MNKNSKFITNLKAIIILNIMTKGHNNLGASGLHGVREKQINEKIEWPWMIEFLHPYQDGRCEYGVSFQYTNMFFL